MRKLHETDFSDCPWPYHTELYLKRAEKNYLSGNYDKSAFPDSFGYKSADEAWRVFCEGKHLLKSEALIHGDYCLPNLVLDSWRFSGFIDLGNGGVGDRHIDLFWGAWTLAFNLGTDAYRARFFDAYGRERIDPEVLDVIGLAEAFG